MQWHGLSKALDDFNPSIMNTEPSQTSAAQPPVSLPPRAAASWKRRALVVCGMILACSGITAAATAWWVKRNIYASPLKPVLLSASEQSALDGKLNNLRSAAEPAPQAEAAKRQTDEARRTLVLTEKEINAFLDSQGLGQQVRVDLQDGAAGVTALIPMAEDIPAVGGTTLRLKVSLSAGMIPGDRFAFRVTDVSLGGIPLPNAWLGDIKGVNLLANGVENDPAIKRFLAGIRELKIESGAIRVLLNH